MQAIAQSFKESGLATLARGKDGKIAALIDHGLNVLVLGVGHMVQETEIGLDWVYGPGILEYSLWFSKGLIILMVLFFVHVFADLFSRRHLSACRQALYEQS